MVLLNELTWGHQLDRAFLMAMASCVVGRKPFRTQDGHIGLGPYVLEPGDLVCVLYGGRVPYILRPRGDGTFVFLGECYVHGIMFGGNPGCSCFVSSKGDWRKGSGTWFESGGCSIMSWKQRSDSIYGGCAPATHTMIIETNAGLRTPQVVSQCLFGVHI